MRVLVTGANGFIGSHIVGALLAAGHDVVGCARKPAMAARRAPSVNWIACDFNRDVTPEAWSDRLRGIDAVVNCAGVLQGSARQSIDRIHALAPAALFDACLKEGVKRVVQISALGIEGIETEYARTKRAGDAHLQSLDLDWVVVRPSLVYGRGAYGGTALMRGLAGFPFVVPLPGGGRREKFQPIHTDDLAAGVVALIDPKAPARVVLDAAGPEIRTSREIVLALRGWLGFGPAPVLPIPYFLVSALARAGDFWRWLTGRGTLTSTSVRQSRHGSIGDPAPFAKACKFSPRALGDALSQEPSQVQDRWHARVYFARPLLRVTLALFWIAAGLIVALPAAREQASTILMATGFPAPWVMPMIWLGAIADTALGLLLLVRWRTRLVGAAMLAVSVVYLAILSWGVPEIWTDPLGALLKILPIMAATLVMMALEDER